MDINKVDLTKAKLKIKKYKNHFKQPPLYGIDTETVNGKLYSIQVYGEDVSFFKYAEGMTAKEIIDWLYTITKGGMFYAHNLQFDFGVMFSKLLEPGTKRVKFDDINATILYPSPCYAVITKQKHRSLVFADSMNFFPMSLKKAATYIGHDIAKLERPEYLGKRKPKKAELENFVRYAMVDAEICYYLALDIAATHEEFDINMRYSVSYASIAAKIYKKYFMTDEIPLPPPNITELALAAYHGGRTEAMGYGHIKNGRVYDIRSSYPYSMSHTKIPLDMNWVETNELHEDGFYLISGKLPKMKISPLCFDRKLLIAPIGEFKCVAVTGIEAIDIQKHCSEFKVIKGYVYKGKYNYSMRDYVDFFYEKKQNAKDKTARLKYKLLMNSLYGKTIQLNAPDKCETRQCGYSSGEGFKIIDNRKIPAGMFNPAIASWITGRSRSKLFNKMKNLEQYVVYCDTDSIFVTKDCPKIKSSNELGEWALEACGHIYIIREKFYVVKQNGKIIKSGRHGFQGNIEDMDKIFSKGNKENKYKITRMVKFYESQRQDKTPFIMEERIMNAMLFPSKKRLCKVPEKSFKNSWHTSKPITL